MPSSPLNPRTQKVLEVAKAQLAVYLSKWPQSVLTVWSSGKVHGGFGSLGIKFPDLAMAREHLLTLGYVIDDASASSSFLDFRVPIEPQEDPRAGLAGNIGEHEDHFNSDGSARA